MRSRRARVEMVRAVVRWYLATYHGGPDDVGVLPSFADGRRMGHMAVRLDAVAAADASEIFRLLVGVAMFQRLRDVLVLKIMRSLSERDARELTTSRTLLGLAAGCACEHARSNAALIGSCDLAKHPVSRRGTCGVAPELDCYLKRHTELLRRYGHFGKMPTSLALAVAERGAEDLNDLRRRALATDTDPLVRAQQLETMLSDAWRVNQKIASLFLSLLTTPNLGLSTPPWASGLDWSWYVVIDSNMDLFLASVGYAGARSYDARREYVRDLAAEIDLSELRPDLVGFNPRLVQQAIFMFMSRSNRRESTTDCMWSADACAACPRVLARACPVRPASQAAP